MVQPAVSVVMSNWGPSSGHTWVTMSGSGFTGLRRVLFGASPALAVTTVSSRTLRVYSPAHSRDAIACVGGGFCLAVDHVSSARTFVDGAWSAPVVAAPQQYDPRLVSCNSAFRCGAVDAEGNLLTHNGSTWSMPTTAPRTPGDRLDLSAIDCVSGTTCIVGGTASTSDGFNQHPVAYTFDGSWTEIALPSDFSGGITALSCQTVTGCTFADQYGSVAYWNGSGWSSSSHPSSHSLISISCGDASDCVAADGYHQIFVESAGTWTPVSSDIVGDALSVSCASATACIVGSYYNGVYTYDGTTFTRATLPGSDTEVRSVDCAQTTFCVAATDKTVYSWNGTTWTIESSPTIAAANVANQPFSSIACSGPTLCAMAVSLPLP